MNRFSIIFFPYENGHLLAVLGCVFDSKFEEVKFNA